MEYYVPAAQKRSARALCNLGLLYISGESGPEKDTEKFWGYMKMSAELGFPEAQNRVGYVYDGGEGSLPCDYKQASKWFKLG